MSAGFREHEEAGKELECPIAEISRGHVQVIGLA
jgi:hypothetical protein